MRFRFFAVVENVSPQLLHQCHRSPLLCRLVRHVPQPDAKYQHHDEHRAQRVAEEAAFLAELHFHGLHVLTWLRVEEEVDDLLFVEHLDTQIPSCIRLKLARTIGR